MSNTTNKASKTVTDPRAVEAYRSLNFKSRAAMTDYVQERAAELEAGSISVRVLAASMRAAGAVRDVPVSPSHAQWFPIISRLLLSPLTGDVSVRTVATTSQKLGAAVGTDAAHRVVTQFTSGALLMSELFDVTPETDAAVDSWELFAECVAQAKAAKSGAGDGGESGEESGESAAVTVAANATADDIIRAAVAALRALDDITMTDETALKTLAKLVASGRRAAKVAA